MSFLPLHQFFELGLLVNEEIMVGVLIIPPLGERCVHVIYDLEDLSWGMRIPDDLNMRKMHSK